MTFSSIAVVSRRQTNIELNQSVDAYHRAGLSGADDIDLWLELVPVSL